MKSETDFAYMLEATSCRIAIFIYYSLNYLHRLVGCPPFWHRRQVVMLRSIMEGRYHFHSPEWDDISESAKNLVSTCRLRLFIEVLVLAILRKKT